MNTLNSLFKNSLRLTVFMLLVNVFSASGQQVQLNEFPKKLQLYPRNPINNRGIIAVSGRMLTAGYTSMVLKIYANNSLNSTLNTNLNYLNGSASFNFSTTVAADTTNWKYALYARISNVEQLIALADSIVCGDVIVVQGQSNALSPQFDGYANPENRNAFIRTFGYRGSNVSLTQSDQNWYVASGDGGNTGSNQVGQWALRLARLMKDKTGVPIAVVNGAFASRTIQYFARNNAEPTDINTNYGRLLRRLIDAGIKNGVRAVLYYQGEADTSAEEHLIGLQNLRLAWQQDFPLLEKIYVFQVSNGCSVYGLYPMLDVRNEQRRFANIYPNVELISTSGIVNANVFTDYCHYRYAGNKQLAQRAFYLINRDLYGATTPANNIEAPSIDESKVYISNAQKTQITFFLANSNDAIALQGNNINNDFEIKLNNQISTTITVTSIQIINNVKIVLNLSASIPPATNTISLGYKASLAANMGAIVNANSIGLTAFANVNVSKTPPTNLPVEWLSVKAHLRKENNALIVWSTATETNNKGFEVQQMTDDKGSFKAIGFVKGNGNTNQLSNYNFAIDELTPGIHTFRLKQIDHNGTFDLSERVAVTVKERPLGKEIEIAPNPTQDITRLKFKVSQEQNINVTLCNVYGQPIKNLYKGFANNYEVNTIEMDLSGLQSGVYFVNINGDFTHTTSKLVKIDD